MTATKKALIVLLFSFLLVNTFTVSIIQAQNTSVGTATVIDPTNNPGTLNSSSMVIQTQEPNTSIVGTVEDNWIGFWDVFDTMSFWSCDPIQQDLTVTRTYPKENTQKTTLEITASQTAEYTITFQIDSSLDSWDEIEAEDGKIKLKFLDFEIEFEWEDVIETEDLTWDYSLENSFTFTIQKSMTEGEYLFIDPSVVGTSKSQGTLESNQRKMFYHNGRFWVFYNNETDIVYRTSTDGDSWSDRVFVNSQNYGSYFALFFNGTHIAYSSKEGNDQYYRCGIPESDGSITWSAEKQLVYDGESTHYYRAHAFCVDSEGYAWIGFQFYNNTAGTYLPQVIKNDNNDGTWSTAAGFPYNLTTFSDGLWDVTPIPLTDGKVYVIYAEKALALGKLYDSGWGEEETISVEATAGGDCVSATNEGDDIHFVYYKTAGANGIKYRKRDFSTGWGTEEIIATLDAHPVISIDMSSNLYVFYSDTGTDHIYYRKYNTTDWEDPVDWVDESADDIFDYKSLTGFYQQYGSYIGVAYLTKLAYPLDVKFAYLTLEAAAEELLFALTETLNPTVDFSQQQEQFRSLIETVIQTSIFSQQQEHYLTFIEPAAFSDIPQLALELLFKMTDQQFLLASWIGSYLPGPYPLLPPEPTPTNYAMIALLAAVAAIAIAIIAVDFDRKKK